MKKLRIGQISPLNLPVPPLRYGGTERIIFWLCQELKKLRHEVILFGSKDSRVPCRLVPLIEKSLWTRPKLTESLPYYAFAFSKIIKLLKRYKLDILHDHLGPWSIILYPFFQKPIIHTLHVPLKGKKERIEIYKKIKAKLVSISFSQRKPARDLNYVANIYHGIDLNEFPFCPKPKNYFFWVGELSKRKGIYEVIKIAKMAKIRLIIAGRIPNPKLNQKEDFEFFQKFIKKELNKNKIFYVGELGRKKLSFYYRNALALLFPLQWEEPFGLNMIESMATGTPVIAFNRGSVKEIVKNGITGFVIKNKKGKEGLKDFVEAIKNISQIERKECRTWVEKNFTKEKMAKEYEKLYLKLLNNEID